ncbi:hypothetical protein LX15_001852 [Streptoalloteichus tenebrarius]|uniref:Uncharacterized protein n=1 Tax=Streptoalloteichus tenebrarius (strain ATCC 17920 / DSM 40477 / JCM 4838 / CBS 697.72 / NBRC 16177 / NCIMB 11028 / NRRL B-12390 / A12253. 1 / ISP 5477) TaxID=1933 RepID=A0ABT1HRQ8_STRSD|nr:hypothetical protein [Streptoalloteichus tenebrarius]MCP2258158.1 hypothetical protein [Streptoalloteichus tenebrarius]BFF04615.1 hypothetical protein GCM10020241_62900 [Streptoalloteichus tenebrarius]
MHTTRSRLFRPRLGHHASLRVELDQLEARDVELEDVGVEVEDDE